MQSSAVYPVRLAREPVESPSLSRLSPQARVEHLMHQQRDWGFERVPVDPDFPESAAIFDEIREVKTFPRLVATVVKDGKCTGYNQLGIAERQVSQAACVDFAVNGRFNPYLDEKKDREDSRRAAQPPSAKDSSTPYQPPYLVYGLNGQPTLETRAVGYSVSNASAQTPVDVPQPQRPAISGAPGASGSLGGNGIARGGFVEQPK